MSCPLDPSLLPLILWTTAAAVAASLLVAWLLLRNRRTSRGIATQPAPVAGNFFHQIRHYKHYYDYLTGVAKKHRTFRLVGRRRDEIFTVDPANVEYIVKTSFSNFGKGWFNELGEELLGDGIFAVDGDKWRHQRKLASFEFSTRVLRDSSTVVFRTNAAKLAAVLREAADRGDAVDMQEMFMRSTMDSIFKIAFGRELNCIGGTNEEESRFAKAFDDSSELVLWRLINPFWKIQRYFKIGSEAALKANVKVVDDFVYKVIAEKVKQMQERSKDGEWEGDDILSRFLLQAEKDPEKMTLKYLRDITLNFVIAGKDTTAGTLSWFLYVLCKHPSVQEKVALEVKEATQASDDTDYAEFAACVTEDAINKMHYLHAVLSETLRLYPAVSLDAKVCFADDQLPDGTLVRRGDVMSFLPYAMGRMKFLWGDDAEIFRPERWLDDNGVFVPESPFKFSAFQAGPRICLGREFAYRQMKVFAAVLLRFFAFALVDESKSVNYKVMLTLKIDGSLPLRISHRGK